MKVNYVLYGEERHRRNKQLDIILKEYDASDLNLSIYDARQVELGVILQDADTPPFFSEYKVIVVNHADFLSTSNDTGYDLKVLEQYLKQPLASTILVFVCDAEKLDSRKKLVKMIKKDWKVLSFAKLDERDKEATIQEEVRRRNLNITPSALRLIMQRLPLDLSIIHNTLDILSLYEGEIDESAASALVHKPLEEDVFALVNAVMEKNLKKAYNLWIDFNAANVDPIYLCALLSGSFRFLYQVKVLMKQGKYQQEIADTLHAHPYRVKKNMESANRTTLSACQKMLARLAKLDQDMKSGLIDKKMGFELFLLELIGE